MLRKQMIKTTQKSIPIISHFSFEKVREAYFNWLEFRYMKDMNPIKQIHLKQKFEKIKKVYI